jgi:probable rRNA maturation factor
VAIHFFYEEVSRRIRHAEKVKKWLVDTIKKEGKEPGDLNYIFCDDSFLYQLNTTYLKHETLTDVITFENTDNQRISGEIYISMERVEENAAEFNVSFEDEVHRVMLHGLLHLLEYTDSTVQEKTTMRFREDFYLNLRPF